MCHKVLMLAVLAFYLHQGEAVKCYTCTSASDPKCGDPIDSSLQATECTPSIFKDGSALLKDAADAASSMLGKIGFDTGSVSLPDTDAHFTCAKAVRQDGDKKVVVRSCSVPKNEHFDFCKTIKAQASGVVTFCETCDSDNCNGASGLAPSAGLFLLVAAFAVLLARQ